MVNELRTVWWDNEGAAVCLIDQQQLPHNHTTVHCTTVAEVAHAIKTMRVRGAPAIGCTAAYGIALAAVKSRATSSTALLGELAAAKTLLDAQRPTAINLGWATTRMLCCAQAHSNADVAQLRAALLTEAHAVLAEDIVMCYAIGDHGAALFPDGSRVLTHCNAGGLATSGYGTALAPLRRAHSQGRALHIYVDETRPFLQGARLTAWELREAGIPQTLITDSMAGHLMQRGTIDRVIVGADRIVANGDVANKIGTYSLAVLARAHELPFYVAAPSSTIDLSLTHGEQIPIEERDPAEVTHLGEYHIAPEGVAAVHPAFDVTPHTLITAIITERGVLWPPFAEQLQAHGEKAQAR